MDNSNALSLAINIINADDQVTDSLKDANLQTHQTSDGIAFAYDPDAYDTYDELADDTLPTIKLGFINEDDDEYYDQPDLTHSLADYMGVDDDDIDLSTLPDIADFTQEKQDDIDAARQALIDKYYSNDDSVNIGSDNAGQEPQALVSGTNANSQIDEVNSAMRYDPSTATFSSSSDIDRSSTTGQNNAQPAPVPASNNDAPDDWSAAANESTGQENASQDNTDNSQPFAEKLPSINGDSSIQPKPSKWLDIAREMFADADHTEMVEFDPNTRKQLQPQILAVEKNIADGRGAGVARIYKRIKDQLPELSKAFEADFKESADKHNDAMDVIDANEKDDIERITKQASEKYDSDREAFIASKHDALGAQYDAENKDNYNKALTAKLNEVRANSEALRHQENSKFKTFKQKEKERYIENEIRKNLEIKDIISDFNKLINADMKTLTDESTHFADRVGVMTKQIVSKLEESKKESESWKNKYNALHDSYTQKVDASVADQTSRNLTVIREELNQKEKELHSRAEENATLKGALKNEQKKSRDLDSVVKQYKAQLELLKNHPAQAAAGYYYPQQGMMGPMQVPTQPQPQPQMTQAPQMPTQPQTQVPQQTQMTQATQATQATNTPESRSEQKKNHRGGRIAATVVGALAIIGLSIGGTAMAFQHHEGQVQTEQSSSVSSSTSSTQPSVASDNAVKKYKAGDTWTYHNKDDNKNYTVTMDNATTGHYTDKNGQQHTITLSNNN